MSHRHSGALAKRANPESRTSGFIVFLDSGFAPVGAPRNDGGEFADQADLVMAPVCGTGERSSNLRVGTRA
jgi:hypothetical protein